MALHGALAEAERQGKELLVREVEIDGASATVAIPFETVDAVVVTRRTENTPGDGSRIFTWQFAAGVLTIYAWQAADADPTLAAGDENDVLVSVLVVGRRRQ